MTKLEIKKMRKIAKKEAKSYAQHILNYMNFKERLRFVILKDYWRVMSEVEKREYDNKNIISRGRAYIEKDGKKYRLTIFVYRTEKTKIIKKRSMILAMKYCHNKHYDTKIAE